MQNIKTLPRTKYQPIQCSHEMAKRILKAEAELTAEGSKQLDILYSAAALVLYRHYGWREKRIFNFVETSETAFADLGQDNDLSAIQLTWEELGIELMCEDCKQHWYEVSYLNSALDDGSKYNQFQFLLMRQGEKRWMAAQITGVILIGLHRKEGWGAERCGRFFNLLEETKQQYDCDGEILKAVCKAQTGYSIEDAIPVIEE